MHDKKDGKFPQISCRYCQSLQPSHGTLLCLDLAAKQTTQQMFAALVQLSSFLESRKLRVTAMAALRRVAKHCADPEFLDVEVSVAAQWCLKSLQSSIRELRIAAG